MAEAIKIGYSDVFSRNEYANKLKKDDFKGLVVEITGLDSDNRVVQLICQTFDNLKKLADFEKSLPAEDKSLEEVSGKMLESAAAPQEGERDVALNLSYTINLVLPKTDDPAVFNAIFRSVRDNLLSK